MLMIVFVFVTCTFACHVLVQVVKDFIYSLRSFQGSAEMREEWRKLKEFGFALLVSKTPNSGTGRTLILRRRTGNLL